MAQGNLLRWDIALLLRVRLGNPAERELRPTPSTTTLWLGAGNYQILIGVTFASLPPGCAIYIVSPHRACTASVVRPNDNLGGCIVNTRSFLHRPVADLSSRHLMMMMMMMILLIMTMVMVKIHGHDAGTILITTHIYKEDELDEAKK